ncbi:MAG: hypothetical protein L0Y58_09130 [Verrucomicrobia subdivision 3 bacterium]|nr:hypothetical protein [Limisphaerales bacterium]
MSKWTQLRLLFRAFACRDLEALHDIAAHYASSYEDGLLPRKYYDRAFRYYEYGAMKGNPACQYDYGFMLILGSAGVQDKERGVFWIKKSAEAGDLAAKDFFADYPQSEE